MCGNIRKQALKCQRFEKSFYPRPKTIFFIVEEDAKNDNLASCKNNKK
jgi:hypothetical protein